LLKERRHQIIDLALDHAKWRAIIGERPMRSATMKKLLRTAGNDLKRVRVRFPRHLVICSHSAHYAIRGGPRLGVLSAQRRPD
jgi:hypothetical protein